MVASSQPGTASASNLRNSAPQRSARSNAHADHGAPSFAEALSQQEEDAANEQARVQRATSRRAVTKADASQQAAAPTTDVPAAPATDATQAKPDANPATPAKGDGQSDAKDQPADEPAKAAADKPVDPVVAHPVEQPVPQPVVQTQPGAPAQGSGDQDGNAVPGVAAPAAGTDPAGSASADAPAAQAAQQAAAPVIAAVAAAATPKAETKPAVNPAEAKAVEPGQAPTSTASSEKLATQTGGQNDAVKAAAAAQAASGTERSERTEAAPQANAQAAAAPTDAGAQPPASPGPQQHQGPLSFAGEVAQRVALQTAAAGSAVPVNTLAVTIAARAAAGSTRFDLKLDPPELGRIDVTMTLDREGRVKSKIVVEKQETLELLQRDQRNLERALGSAGLNTTEGSVEFSLRDQSSQGFARDQGSEGRASGSSASGGGGSDAEQASSIQSNAVIYARLAAARGGVDIRI